jgi:hypothetical protein
LLIKNPLTLWVFLLSAKNISLLINSMSQLEVSTNSDIYTFTYDPMVAGSALNGAAIPNFNGTTSKVIGCVRVTAGGTVGQPYVAVVNTGTALFPPVLIRSGSALDTSVYRIYWINEVAQSQIATALAC